MVIDALGESLPPLRERVESFGAEVLPQVGVYDRDLSRMEDAAGALDPS